MAAQTLEPNLTLCSAMSSGDEACQNVPLPDGVFCNVHAGDAPPRVADPAVVSRCQAWVDQEDCTKSQCRRPEASCTSSHNNNNTSNQSTHNLETCNHGTQPEEPQSDQEQLVLSLIEQVSILEGENSVLVAENSHMVERNSVLEAENRDLVQRNSVLTGWNTDLEKRNSSLMLDRNADLVDRNTELFNRNAALTKRNAALEANRNSVLENRNKILVEQYGELECLERAGRVENERLATQLQAIRGEMVAQQKQFAEAFEKLKEVKASSDNLVKGMDGKSRDQVQEAPPAAENKDQEICLKDQEIARLRAALEKAAVDRDALADSITAYSGRPANASEPAALDRLGARESEGETPDDTESEPDYVLA